MYEAIEKDNVDEVQQLIASGYDISQPLVEIPPEANHFLLQKPFATPPCLINGEMRI